MSKYFGMHSPEIVEAIRAFGVDPKDVRRVELVIDANEMTAVTITLHPDRKLPAALLAASRTAQYDITVRQLIKTTTEPRETPEDTEWSRW